MFECRSAFAAELDTTNELLFVLCDGDLWRAGEVECRLISEVYVWFYRKRVRKVNELYELIDSMKE